MPPGARNVLVADPNICFQWLPGDLQRHKYHAFVLHAPWHGLNACVLSCHAPAYTPLGWGTNWSLPHVKCWAANWAPWQTGQPAYGPQTPVAGPHDKDTFL